MSHQSVSFGERIDIRPLGSMLATAKSASLLDSPFLKIKRMILLAGKSLPEHRAPGAITVQCLEGRLRFTADTQSLELEPGQLVALPAGERHAVLALEDSSFLLTILLADHP